MAHTYIPSISVKVCACHWSGFRCKYTPVSTQTLKGRASFSSDCSIADFTLDNVIRETSEIKDIFDLAYPLLFDSKMIKKVIRSGTLDKLEHRRQLIYYWMSTDPVASWEKLARQYSDCLPHHKEMIERIRSKYVPPIEVVPLHPKPTFS